MRLVRGTALHLARTPLFVSLVSTASWIYRTRMRRGLRRASANGDAVSANTIAHNLTALSLKSVEAFSAARPDRLLRVLSTIESVRPATDRILFVGPRADSELLLARGYGFKKRNIRGLDLISYSPHIDLGDMHAMPYPDDSWDIVVLGWVLAYSNDFQLACSEVARVLRPGGLVAAGIHYHPLSPQEIADQIGYVPGSLERIESTGELFELFGSAVDIPYFRHDIRPEARDRPGDILTVFSVS